MKCTCGWLMYPGWDADVITFCNAPIGSKTRTEIINRLNRIALFVPCCKEHVPKERPQFIPTRPGRMNRMGVANAVANSLGINDLMLGVLKKPFNNPPWESPNESAFCIPTTAQ